jgi:tetratricopeptide (TPR) repeat protein
VVDAAAALFSYRNEGVMKYFLALIVVLMAAACSPAQNSASSSNSLSGNSVAGSSAASGSLTRTRNDELSPAQRSMAEVQRLIGEKPAEYGGYNALANALIRRARETSDPDYFAQAEDAVQKSLKLSPNNFDTSQIQVSILLGEHEYPAALEAAQALNKQVPDAVMVYGLLTDANMALGNYKDAETSAQWMLNLRPGNLPALIRAAQLRELFGDVDGSNELFHMAYQSTAATETEERAWLLTQMGRLRLASGNSDAAEQLLQQALTVFANYPQAMTALAKVRMVQGRYEDAVSFFRQGYKSAPCAENLYTLAEALRLAGHQAEAKKEFAEFEVKALAESAGKNNANRELIFYYADYAHQPGKALAVAKQEYSWRQDVYTLDAYSWALHVSGQDAEARKQIGLALAVGIRDAQLFRHAGELALKTGDRGAAERYLKESADLNAAGSAQARDVLAQLSPAGRRSVEH